MAKLNNFFPLAAEQNRDTTTRTNRTAREMSKPLSGLRTAPHLVSSSVYLTTLGPLCMLPLPACTGVRRAVYFAPRTHTLTRLVPAIHPPARFSLSFVPYPREQRQQQLRRPMTACLPGLKPPPPTVHDDDGTDGYGHDWQATASSLSLIMCSAALFSMTGGWDE